jgi:F-box/WD-40 domain protein 7
VPRQVDPVILATGHTYDRHSIERWLAQGHKTCPVTGMRLRHLELTPNFALRSAIVDWAQQNGVKLPERATQQTVQPVFKWDEGRAGNILHVGAAAARAARARCPTASG